MTDTFREHILLGSRRAMPYCLAADRTAPTGLTGARLANHAGASLDFMDHRDYHPGDDIRRIDWSAFARSDKLILKLFREEVTPHADIILDTSRSMDLPQTSKPAAALSLTAFFAQAARNSSFTHASWTLAEQLQPLPHSTEHPSAWPSFDFDHPTDPGHTLTRTRAPFRARACRILISDLFWSVDPLRALTTLSRNAAALVVIQLLAPVDLHGPDLGSVRLLDTETDETLDIFIDAPARLRYHNALAQHQQNWRRACRQASALFVTLDTDQLLRDWDLTEMLRLQVLRLS